ncbi:MAG: polysaccharide ABC transporter ATP-binding protein [Bacteroidales bacterium]|nr:polysaccharide ABC transporter ATP-binding protein [Bacteroidales bacterium]
MNTPILELTNISKQYRLGYVGTGTMSDDLRRWWYRVRGKEDPYLKIGEENDRTQVGDSEYVWALRDINLQVQQGEVLGIIGANGAGKSTLLKILSRVTGPTTGTITARGRIASLLEVGTGFHGELTGRENIFLNGAILGMTKREIQSKFDEIVDFAGCQRYIDTPVKRYSSGMYVRLAFAVAAHLEPEILIVDEVLAVGDAEFQKKAIGKMKDISSGQGRTVLFVSHNMAAVKSICHRCVVLQHGKVVLEGNTNTAIQQYLSGFKKAANHRIWKPEEIKHEEFELKEAYIKGIGKQLEDAVEITEPLELCISLVNKTANNRIDTTLHFKDGNGDKIFMISSNNVETIPQDGKIVYRCEIPGNFFNNGTFSMDLYIVKDRKKSIYTELDILEFTLVNEAVELGKYMGEEPGALRPVFQWKINNG